VLGGNNMDTGSILLGLLIGLISGSAFSFYVSVKLLKILAKKISAELAKTAEEFANSNGCLNKEA